MQWSVVKVAFAFFLPLNLGMSDAMTKVFDRCSKCDGFLDCPELTPNDEGNCTKCPSYRPNRCDCNKEENFTCEFNQSVGRRYTCYSNNGER